MPRSSGNPCDLDELFLDALDAIIWEADPGSARYGYVSQGAEKMLGYPIREWLDQPDFWACHIFEEDREREVRRRCEAVEGGAERHDSEYRMTGADGRPRWVRDRVYMMKTPEGRCTSLRGITVQTTDRKNTELSLRSSEMRYRAFVEQSTEGIWRCQFSEPARITLSEDELIDHFYRFGILTECNTAFATMYGFGRPEEIVGVPLGKLLPREDPHNIAYLRAFTRSGYRLVDAESHEMDRHENAKYFSNNLIGILADGIIQEVWGTQRDITERKLAEEALRRRDAILQAVAFAAERLLMAPDWSAVVNDVLERLGQAAGISRAYVFERKIGVRGQFCVNHRFGWCADGPHVHVDHPRLQNLDAVLEGFEKWAEMLEKGLPIWGLVEDFTESQHAWFSAHNVRSVVIMPIMVEHQLWGFLGCDDMSSRRIWTQAEIEALRAAAGTLAAAIEWNRLEVRLRQSQKMEAVGRLAGGIAHDFNNLLTAITGYADILLKRLHPEDPIRREVSEIHRAGERAASLTRQLLAFSRRQLLKPRIMDLNTIVADMDRMLRRLIGEHIELVTRLAPDLWLVRADPGQIEQVILNLSINSRDAMSEGGTLTIETSNQVWESSRECVVLEITDTGCGMSAEVQRHIFEPFFTTKAPGKGTGLGLSTVYGIVEQSGGRITPRSEVGKGTSFHICLPRVLPELPAERRPEAVVSQATGSERILLVEDEDIVRRMAKEILETAGYEVIDAENGKRALAAVERTTERIAMMITDVVMPGISGPDLARTLREKRPDLRVLYISGYADETLLDTEALPPGFEFLHKPFTPEDLRRAVRGLIDAAL